MKKVDIGRIAFRAEDGRWNAYLAKSDTMEGATLLGSIRMTFIRHRPDRKQQFMDLMKDCFNDACEELFDQRAEFSEEPAKNEEN